jgi:hypothetical protein
LLQNSDRSFKRLQLGGCGFFLELASQPVTALMTAVFERNPTLVGQLEELLSSIARIKTSCHQLLLLQLGDNQPHALMLDVTMRSNRAYARRAMTVKQT